MALNNLSKSEIIRMGYRQIREIKSLEEVCAREEIYQLKKSV